jgi:hypothetical protein
MYKWYVYIFANGKRITVRGFSKQELAVEEQKHGKLIRKEKYNGMNSR